MVRENRAQSIGRVGVVATYFPRKCGIGTFTNDLCDALSYVFPALECIVLPVSDREEGYAYSARARFELAEKDLSSYRRATEFLNINDIDVLSIQHEYGIYGGVAGSHILSLMHEVGMPAVTTLHTVLREPDVQQRRVLEEVAECSDVLVVMSEKGRSFLREIYSVPDEKIEVIAHGIPDVPFVDPSFYKDHFGVEGKHVLLTFGLLSSGKGLEYVIAALPKILEKHPDVVYIILGATHPAVRREKGELYRLSLERAAQELGVAENVIFHNHFVEPKELTEFMGACDIYITPYLNEAQITSGTLAYAVGAGKAIVSTPYWHAQELLAGGRGLLVPFKDADAIAEKVLHLLDNTSERHAMRKNAYLYGRDMIWPKVASRYMETFARARDERSDRAQSVAVLKSLSDRPPERPVVKLKYLQRLTDNTGIFQHALYNVPNYSEGYTTDDNARALALTVLLEGSVSEEPFDAKTMAARYLSFLHFAWNPEKRRFRNFMSYDRRWLSDVGSEDSHGRALCALGRVIGHSSDPGLVGLAHHLFEAGLGSVLEFRSPRAWAYALVGIRDYLGRFSGDRAAGEVRSWLGERLFSSFQQNSSADWPWCEDRLTYVNARLPQGLLSCGIGMERGDMTDTALRSLEWLAEIQRAEEGHFRPIGSNGFFVRGQAPARFDQQPVEARAMVSACLDAHALTDDPRWREEAERAFQWFLGRNDLGVVLYDPSTGGCRDGLHSDRVNQNQGAESTLSFLHSLIEMRLADTPIPPFPDGLTEDDAARTDAMSGRLGG